MLFGVQLLADAAGDQTPAPPTGSSIIPMLGIGVVFVLFYIFMIRGPMKRQEQERQSLLVGLKKNDEVVTSGGVIGVVANISDNDEVTLKVDERSNVPLLVIKSSIPRKLSKEKTDKEPTETRT